MTRPQKQLMLLGVLGAVMVAVYVRALRPSPSEEPAQRATPAAEVPASKPVDAVSIPLQPSGDREAQRARAVRLAWTRDPFLRGARGGMMSGFTLSGILWDEEEPLAIINGQMLHVGDDIEGYQVTEILHDRVAISDGADSHQLQIAP